MKELVVCSGKGGTGKTSVVASFAALASHPVLADCDVDAADLHLVLSPEIEQRKDFWSGREAVIRPEDCSGCGTCQEVCQFGAIQIAQEGQGAEAFVVDPLACEGCGVCVQMCPEGAIDFPERICGQWFISRTRYGPLIHARLGIGAENSGKLVTLVRRRARLLVEEGEGNLLIVDGPPGIGCPVIASLAGADLVLVVTEPTLSGLHDLERVVKLTRHFSLPVSVCLNKHDLNSAVARDIVAFCHRQGLNLVGKIPYDPAVTAAQLASTSVVERDASPAAAAIREVWEQVEEAMNL
jgi:MinD superfamily P-loop ATPase